MTGLARMDIGLFAHDEAAGIATVIDDLARQDILEDDRFDIRVLILANGCHDQTVPIARSAIAALPDRIRKAFVVLDLPEPGKSRTAHRFIHDLSRPEADMLGFMDADIELPRPDSLRRMAEALLTRPELQVFTSHPVKDVAHHRLRVGLSGRLITAGGDGLTDWRKSICGQLFVMRAAMARQIGLPAGLPVEDGFFRAMALTDLLSRPEDLARIDGDPEVFHVYRSIRGLGELLRHQTRIVIGSAVNAALYRKIRREAPDRDQAHALLMQAAAQDGWLTRVLKEELPRRPYGYVPTEFLTKRWRRFRSSGKRGLKPRLMLLAGMGLDALVWLRASYQMHRGAGSGHW